jgi:peptidoglycan/LPS O-acetylase OafA/YrhL
VKVSDSRIDFLDFMRIFAFLSVLIGHKFYGVLAALASDPAQHVSIRYFLEWLLSLCMGGAAGVVAFFFVSGYIITHVLRVEAAPEFLVKRVFRIYPLYVVAVLLEVFLAWLLRDAAFPPLSLLLPRLLLLGDIFGTPYALAGVEWTLRVEMAFYLFMAILKVTGLLNKPAWLPLIYLGCVMLLCSIEPFPQFEGGFTGYLTIYSPFLLIGSLIYLMERRLANPLHCLSVMALAMLASLALVAKVQPFWKESHYALLALLVFVSAWWFRRYLVVGPIVRVLSSLTYAIYLMHNWLWPYLSKFAVILGGTGIARQLLVLVMLFLVCYVLHRLVELPVLRLGRAWSAKYLIVEPRRENVAEKL